jgi:hypothetical protein
MTSTVNMLPFFKDRVGRGNFGPCSTIAYQQPRSVTDSSPMETMLRRHPYSPSVPAM